MLDNVPDKHTELESVFNCRIGETLNGMRGIKGQQDETTRKTRELEFELGQFSAVNTKMEDLKQRVEENGQSMHNIYIKNTHKMA